MGNKIEYILVRGINGKEKNKILNGKESVEKEGW